jgi:hypothetical protein
MRAAARLDHAQQGPPGRPTGINEYSKKIIDSIKDLDLFRVKNKFAHDRYTKTLGINPLVKRLEPIQLFVSLVLSIMMSKLIIDPE